MTTTLSTWTLRDNAPAGGLDAIAGEERHGSNTPLHGTWSQPLRDGTERLVVANSGHVLAEWNVPDHRWRFASPLVRTVNFVITVIPWVWSAPGSGRLFATSPSDATVAAVIARRKPLGLADTPDPAQADRWCEAAAAAGCAVHRHSFLFDCGPVPYRTHFVEVAVRDRFRSLFDLDVLAEDYAACGVEGSDLDAVESRLDELRTRRVSDLIDDAGLIVPVDAGDYVRTGLTLGYDPATTAGIILGLDARGRARRTPVDVGELMCGLARIAEPADLPGEPL